MKLATLLLAGSVALGALGPAAVLADDKGRGYDRDDHPRHEIHRHKHYHHYDKPRRHYDRDHRKQHWKGDRAYIRQHWRHERGHGKPHWKRAHGGYWYDYQPYRYEYRYRPKHRDSWYGIHLFFGG